MIGVFDSGMGGLTAVKEIFEIMPDAGLIFFGDTGRVPYGTRSRETIINYALQDARFLASKKVDAILVACGTVSSTAMPELKKALDVPVLGVVEATSEAAVKATRNGKIGIIGTPATINSGSYVDFISKTAPELETFCTACPLFVPLVEEGFSSADCEITRLTVEHYLADIREKGIDTLILGCTHYPVMGEAIARAMPGVTLINSGAESARRLHEMGLLKPGGGAHYYVSDSTEHFTRLASRFLGRALSGSVEYVEIDKY